MTQTVEDARIACRNCGAAMVGAWCHACGQKRVTGRGLGQLLGEAFHQVTDVDGKLLRSLRLLLFFPGRLSREYLDDRRARYSAPLSLFLLANVLYFFAPALTDFNLPFADQVPGTMALQSLDPDSDLSAEHRQGLAHSAGQMHSRWTAPLVERKVAARAALDPGYDLRVLARDYDNEAGIVGKVLMIVHVPILALALALAFVRQRRYFAEHFVVALHLFTFLLLFVQVVMTPLHWLTEVQGPGLPPAIRMGLGLSLLGVLLAYFLLACRTAYRVGWGAAVLGLVAVLFGLWVANLWVYRALQFLVTLAQV
jgi:Protein of unknown function (DUF3667)